MINKMIFGICFAAFSVVFFWGENGYNEVKKLELKIDQQEAEQRETAISYANLVFAEQESSIRKTTLLRNENEKIKKTNMRIMQEIVEYEKTSLVKVDNNVVIDDGWLCRYNRHKKCTRKIGRVHYPSLPMHYAMADSLF